MEIEYVTGCICDSLSIDNKETIDMELKELKEVIIKVINNTDNLAALQGALISIVENTGEFEDLGHCEECGDYIEKYTLSIN